MSKSNWYKQKEFATDVTANGDWRGDCPFCGGKKTFTATLDMGTVVWNCYKLGCDVSGTYSDDLTASQVRQLLRPAPEVEQKEPETMVIPAQIVYPTAEHTLHTKFVNRWGVHGRTMYDVQQERVVFPIYYKGRIIDAVGRAVGQRKHPKWYRYTGLANWFTCGSGDSVVLVEDVVSAIIVNQLIPNVVGMAILGTSLTPKHMEKIQEYNKVIIALDPDAMGKTIEYRREIELWTGIKTRAIYLKDDIKYKLEEDIQTLKGLLS